MAIVSLGHSKALCDSRCVIYIDIAQKMKKKRYALFIAWLGSLILISSTSALFYVTDIVIETYM